MKSIPLTAPNNLVVLDEPDPNAGGASHAYGIQWGGPQDVTRIQFQHGARGKEGSVAGIFDDALLAIVEDRLLAFQSGPFACAENADALVGVQAARKSFADRVAKRVAAGALGSDKRH